MNKKINPHLAKIRRNYHLKLKDTAYLLNIDQTILSRLETGKKHNLKALVAYHYLFNLSMDSSIRQVLAEGFEDIIHRCFLLLESLEHKPKTNKNRMRIDGINQIINRLNSLIDAYED